MQIETDVPIRVVSEPLSLDVNSRNVGAKFQVNLVGTAANVEQIFASYS